MRMINKQLTELTLEQVSFLVSSILAKSHLEQNYNPDLQTLLQMFIKKEALADVQLMELYSLEMHVLHDLLFQYEDIEKYEMCAKIKQVINIEKELFKEWILAMNDEEIKDDCLEEFNYTNIYFTKYKINE